MTNYKPRIDIHEHIFRGRDIPLMGYLMSRNYGFLLNVFLKYSGLLQLVAWCITRSRRRNKRRTVTRYLLIIATFIMGKGYRRWAEIMALKNIDEIWELLYTTYKKDKIELYTPLVIDYEYWFRNTYDTNLKLQMEEIYEDVIIKNGGMVHPFVPFDPVRELAFRNRFASPDGTRERLSSLALVKYAIENWGYIGVKLYPALGYRPINNSAMHEKRKKNIFFKNKMYDYARFSGDEYDAVLDELYRYCMTEQVPILTHCVSGGIESYPGASYDYGAPGYWYGVLDQPGYSDLHVNFAHFGWTGVERYNTTGKNRKGSWVREICEMIKKYRYVYTDCAHHNTTTALYRKEFEMDLPDMCRDYPGIIQKKMIYGIDWHVWAKEENYQLFMECYLDVLRKKQLYTEEQINDFLGGNAVHFLGLLPKNINPDQGWNKNRFRLEKFYHDHHITPPKWFVETGKWVLA